MSAEARGRWDAAAPGWERHRDWYERSVAPLTDWFCATVARPGARLVDVACGVGTPALAMAAKLRPGGSLVATDLAPAMLAATRRGAQAAGLDHVQVLEMDAAELRLPDGAFDAVTCACGLMFAGDPVRTLAGMRRVLRRGGRVALSVWDAREHNPFFTVAGEALRAAVGEPAATPVDPWALAAPGAVERALLAAGFTQVEVTRCEIAFEVDSPETHWQRFTELAPGVAEKLAAAPPDALARATAAMRSGDEPFRAGRSYRLPARALCATGTAP